MATTDDPIHVLYVDAEPESAGATARHLEREDDRLTVRPAGSVDEGLSIVADRDVDCVVSGTELPGDAAIEFLRDLRDRYSDLPSVLLTDAVDDSLAVDALAAGATDHVLAAGQGNGYALSAHRIRTVVDQTRAARRATAQRRINAVIRTTNEALARASTRAEVDERVCAILSDAEPYRFAWIGEHHPDSETVEPRHSVGIGEDYLRTLEITTGDEPTGQGPTGRAVRTGAVAVMQNIPEAPEYEAWREAAVERGFESSAAVPLTFEDTLYGVLNVYADRTGAFDDHERQLLSNLGETIGHAYHRIKLQRRYTDQYRTLFEEAPVMVVRTRAVDGEPIIEECNEAFADRLGYAPEELCGTPLSERYSAASSTKLGEESGYQRALDGESLREQRTLLTREGEEVLTILRASPRWNRDGELIGTHALYLDITEERQVRELKRQNQRLEEFTSVVSHDLRNPLNVAQGRSEMARAECDSDHLEDVSRALDRMETLIDDLLTLAREGKSVEATEPTDLAATVDGCWRNVGTGDATLVVDSERTIRADRSRLEQLFENLVRNAIEHGGDDATVTVGEVDDGFFVADDGPGIPEDERERVFDSGYSTANRGTGFGLSIVREIAEAHGWEISVTESADGGARFEIAGVDVVAE